MIFVTVGTHQQPFDRLIRKVDELIAKGKIREKVVAQIGYCKYEPKNCVFFRFAPLKKVEKLIDSANLVITHGGIGSILLVLRKRKKIIVVPRMREFGEHTNNHQIQIVKELEKQKLIIAVYNIEELGEAVERSRKITFKLTHKKSIIISEIDRILERWRR